MSRMTSEWDLVDDEPIEPYSTFTIDDLSNLPEPTWLVDGVVPNHSYGALYGVPGAGKSFAILDMLLSVASGKAWHGHKTEQGPVLYFAGEGVRGLQRRVRAWLAANPDIARDEVMSNFRVVPQVPSFASKREMERAIATSFMDGRPAKWVVFDTLARGMSAGSLDENKASDMGRVNDFAEGIRNVTGAAVWMVHHTGKDGSAERGSVALRGACDTMILVKPDVGVLTLAVSKQKDAREATPVSFRLVDVPDTGSAVLQKDGGLVGSAFVNAEARYGVRTPPPAAVGGNPWAGDF